MQRSRIQLGWPALAKLHEERSIERAGSAPHFHHERATDAVEKRADVARRQSVEIGEHGFETAPHVEPMIAVADCLVEFSEFVGVRDNTARDRVDDDASLGYVHVTAPRARRANRCTP